MVLDQIGLSQTQQFKNTSKVEKPSDNWVYSAQIDKLFDNHNHILTRVLQDGLKIPQELQDKIAKKANFLKKIYFGLDNYIIEPSLLPKDQGKFVVIYTDTMPIIVPQTFLTEEASLDLIQTNKLILNLVDEKDWYNVDIDDLGFCEFLKAGLVFFSSSKLLKKENIKMVHICDTPVVPQHSVIFSRSCNFFTLLLFFYSNQQYFPSLQIGMNAYLKFIREAKK